MAIGRHGGGSKNIEAVKNSSTELTDLRLKPEQIVTLSGYSGALKA